MNFFKKNTKSYPLLICKLIHEFFFLNFFTQKNFKYTNIFKNDHEIKIPEKKQKKIKDYFFLFFIDILKFLIKWKERGKNKVGDLNFFRCFLISTYQSFFRIKKKIPNFNFVTQFGGEIWEEQLFFKVKKRKTSISLLLINLRGWLFDVVHNFFDFTSIGF